MKRKAVMKVSMHGCKCRAKAMRIVAGFPGVISVELQGTSGDLIVLTGEDVDHTQLAAVMRKKMGNSDIVNISDIPEKKDDSNTKPETGTPPVWTPYPYCPPHCHNDCETCHHSSQQKQAPDPCTIL